LSEWLRWRRRDARDARDRDLTDARTVAEHVRRQAFDPAVRRRVKRRRRTLVLGLCSVCLAGTLVAVIGKDGYLDMVRLRGEISGLSADIERRRAEIERLQQEVRRLEQDPLARERVAREQLGLVRPGEVDFLLPKDARQVWEAAPSVPGPSGR
jgi:cell division protein FtsB